MKSIYAALVAVALSLFALPSFAACVGVNILAGGCSQTEGAAGSASTAQGSQAIIGFSASGAQNTSTATSFNVTNATPVAQSSVGGAATQSTTTQAGVALGLAQGSQAGVGASGAAYNGAAVGGFGFNVYALPTP